MRRWQRRLVAAAGSAAAALGLVMLPATAAHAACTTYYVSSSSGSDSNDGCSASTPWQTLTNVNSTTFTAGNQILFQDGGSWTGELQPQGSGSSGSPIVISSYGSGAAPILNGGGAAATIYLKDQQYWTIQNLEITNPASSAALRSGIQLENDTTGTLAGIHIVNNNIHEQRRHGQRLPVLRRRLLERLDDQRGVAVQRGRPPVRTRVLDAVDAAAPDLKIDIRPGASRYLLNSVHAGEVDLALVCGPVVDPGLRTHPVSRRPLGIVVAAGSAFDGHTSVRLEELAPLTFAMYGQEDSPALLRHVDGLLHDAGVHRRLTVDSPVGLPHVVSTGHAFTVMANDESGVVQRIFAEEKVLCLPIDGAHLELTTLAVWRQDREKQGDPVADLADAVTGLPLPKQTPPTVAGTE